MSLELTTIQRTALNALADACEFSINAHPPEGAILRKVQSHLRGDVRKALSQLRRMGLAQRHPTGRNTTWNITQAGLSLAQQ